MLQKPKFMKENWKTSLGFGGEIKYNLNEKTSLTLAFTYIPFKLDLKKLGIEDANIKGGEIKTSVISANLDFYLTPPEASAGFYIAAGGGYYMLKAADLIFEGVPLIEGDNEGENKFGVNGGLGFEIKVGESLTLFAEGKYHYVFTKEDKDLEADQKGKVQFITVMGGLRLSL
jgi:opacity protein-like surface antigen